MSVISYNYDIHKSAKKAAQNCIDKLTEVQKGLYTYKESANSKPFEQWKAKGVSETKVNEYMNYANRSLVGYTSCIANDINQISKVREVLIKIKKAIDVFEDTTVNKDFKKKLNKVLNSNYTIKTENGTRVVYYVDPETGKMTSVSEMINGFYTYMGCAAGGAVEKYLMNGGLTDAELSKHVNDTGSYVDALSEKGFFSVAHNKGIDQMYKDAGGASSLGDWGNKYNKLLEEHGSETVEEAAKRFGTDTNSSNVGALAVAGFLIGTIAYPYDVKTGGGIIEIPTDPERDEGKKDKVKGELMSVEAGVISGITGTIVNISQPVTNELPDYIDVNINGNKNYDILAREQYESLGAESIAQIRATVTQEANELFEAQDKTALKEKLAGYGYDERDIELIIQDRDLTVKAMLDGEQRLQLTDISKELFTTDGVDYDTSFDDAVSFERLENGEADQLLNGLDSDSEYIDYKEHMGRISDEYKSAATEANVALDNVNKCEQEVAAIKEDIMKGLKDKDNWATHKQLEYDNVIDELRKDYVDKYGKASNWTEEQSNAFKQARASIKQEFVTAIQNDSSCWKEEFVVTYDKAVTQYNESVEVATEKIDICDHILEEYNNVVNKSSNIHTNVIIQATPPEVGQNIDANTTNISTETMDTADVTTSTTATETTGSLSNEDLLNGINIQDGSASLY